MILLNTYTYIGTTKVNMFRKRGIVYYWNNKHNLLKAFRNGKPNVNRKWWQRNYMKCIRITK